MKKRWIIFMALISIITLYGDGQGAMYLRGKVNSWGSTAMNLDSELNVWSVSLQYNGGTGDSGFKFTDGTGWDENWGRGDFISTKSVEPLYVNGANTTYSENVGSYYFYNFFDVENGSNSQTVLQELSGSPNTISSITEPTSFTPNQSQTITITLSGNKVAEEKIYLCYTTDNWTTRTNVLASGSDASWSADIPGQSIGTIIEYYVMTTTATPSLWEENEALFTLDHEYTESNPLIYAVNDAEETTNHTILIDGENDFLTSTERSNGSGSENYWWYTWDENNFYFAIQQGAVGEGSAEKFVVLYLDTDPELNETSGTGTTTGYQYANQQPGLPFSANYHFSWSADESNFNLYEYTESWAISDNNMSAYRNGSFFEVKIPLSDLGNPTQMYLSGCMLCQTSGDESMWTFSPSDASSDNTDGFNKDIDSYWSFDLSSGETPNAPGNEDNPLPVTLSSLTAVYQGGLPVLNWVTSSENNNAGWNIYRADTENEEFSLQINAELIIGEGTTTELTEYRYEDIHECETGIAYYYWLESLDYSNHTESYGPVCLTIPEPVDESGEIHYAPEMYGLQSNYPNPFNPSTTISFMLSYTSPVSLEIFNLTGQKIASLLDQKPVNKSEMQYITWDGKDDSGTACGSGIYFYRLSTDREINSQKMILIK